MIEQLDTRFKGIAGAICCHRVGTTLIDCGPESSIGHVVEALGDVVPETLLLTHIHLDHAGGAGRLVEHYPQLQVFIHEAAVQHLVDPSRLLSSAERVFGETLADFGETLPVPAANVHALRDGDVVEGFEAMLTPGHSGHHLAFHHDETKTAFVGDLVGQVLPPHELTLLSTAPPEVDVELWIDSIDRVAERYPSTLCVTHFGRVTDVAGQLERAKRELRRSSEHARDEGQEQFVAYLEQQLETVPPEVAESLVTALPPFDQLFKGYERYWSKRVQA